MEIERAYRNGVGPGQGGVVAEVGEPARFDQSTTLEEITDLAVELVAPWPRDHGGR